MPDWVIDSTRLSDRIFQEGNLTGQSVDVAGQPDGGALVDGKGGAPGDKVGHVLDGGVVLVRTAAVGPYSNDFRSEGGQREVVWFLYCTGLGKKVVPGCVNTAGKARREW